MDVAEHRNPITVAFVAFAASATSLRNGFAYDDIPIIAANARVHDLGSWWTLFGMPYWPPQYGESLYRPLSVLGYAVQWAVGNGAPVVFHLVSMALYILLSLTVLWLLRELLDEGAALAGAALFAAHPVHTEAVANVVGQAELLAGIAAVGAVTLYLRARADGPTRREASGIAALYAGASLAKEHALLLPLLLGAAELIVPRGRAGRGRAGRLLLILGAIGVAIIGARFMVLGSVFGEQNPVEMDRSTRLWTMFRVVPEWVRLLTWPSHLSAEYGPQQIEIVDGPTPLSVLGIALFALLVVGFVVSPGRQRVVAFGLAWLAITFVPVSNLVSGVVLQERTLMLPSVGAVIVAAVLLQWMWNGVFTGLPRRGLTVAVALLVVAGVVRSARRNPVWRDNLALFSQTVRDAPRSYRAHYVYGSALFNLGRAREGERELRSAIALSRNDSDPFNLLATQYRDAGLYAQAIPLYRQALEIRPGRPDARFGLALALLESGDPVGARAQADTGLAGGQLKAYFEWVRARADSALLRRGVDRK